MSGVRWLVSLFILDAALIIGGRSALAQTCTVTTTQVSFGIYNVFSTTDLASTGTVTYRCSGWVYQPSVYLSKGSATSNNPRQMVSGANRLNYNVYLDAAHTNIWGDPNPFSYRYNGWLHNADVTLTVYGLIPRLQDVSSGTYTDSIIATLNF